MFAFVLDFFPWEGNCLGLGICARWVSPARIVLVTVVCVSWILICRLCVSVLLIWVVVRLNE